MKQEIINLELKCQCCGNVYKVPVIKEQYDHYIRTGDVMESFPDMSLDMREILISGICGYCFDKLFADEEDA